MKVKIDIDVKPEEVRTLIGLPDVQGLQEDVIEYVRDKLASGADALEAVNILKQFVPESINAVGTLQKTILKGWGKIAGDNAAAEEAEKKDTETKPAAKKKVTSTKANKK